jgi:hypothetical protein
MHFFCLLIHQVTFPRESPQSYINVANCMYALLFSTSSQDLQSTGVVHVWQLICLHFTERLGHWLGAKRILACFFSQQFSEIYKVKTLQFSSYFFKLPFTQNYHYAVSILFSVCYTFFQMWLNHFITISVKNVSNTFSTETQRRWPQFKGTARNCRVINE